MEDINKLNKAVDELKKSTSLDDNKPRQMDFGARYREVPSLIDSLEEYKLDGQLDAASQKLDELAKLGYKSSEPPMKVFDPDEYKGVLDGVNLGKVDFDGKMDFSRVEIPKMTNGIDLGKVDFDGKMDFSRVEIPPMPSTEEMRDLGKKAQELLNKNNIDKDKLLMLDEIERRRLQLEREAQERRERRK